MAPVVQRPAYSPLMSCDQPRAHLYTGTTVSEFNVEKPKSLKYYTDTQASIVFMFWKHRLVLVRGSSLKVFIEACEDGYVNRSEVRD